MQKTVSCCKNTTLRSVPCESRPYIQQSILIIYIELSSLQKGYPSTFGATKYGLLDVSNGMAACLSVSLPLNRHPKLTPDRPAAVDFGCVTSRFPTLSPRLLPNLPAETQTPPARAPQRESRLHNKWAATIKCTRQSLSLVARRPVTWLTKMEQK
jgi:hypothetical protein